MFGRHKSLFRFQDILQRRQAGGKVYVFGGLFPDFVNVGGVPTPMRPLPVSDEEGQ